MRTRSRLGTVAAVGLLVLGLAAAVGPSASARVGADSTDATIVPDSSWNCGLSAGIVPPTRGQLVAKATLPIASSHDVGETRYGHRRALVTKSGSLTGSRVQATVLAGGLDLELTLSTGAVELEQDLPLKLSDGTSGYLRVCGVAAPGDSVVRVVPDFEVPTGSSAAWLNTGKFVGTRSVDKAAGTVSLALYDVSQVSAGDSQVRLTDPSGVPNQSWTCVKGSGSRGAVLFTEQVSLGGSVTVGNSKYGYRNIVSITGGTVSGKVSGTVVNGGADYQLNANNVQTLDAKYLLTTKDGESILVRNCGPIGGMAPVFETRAAGAYGYLATGSYLSADPSVSGSSVTIVFYERK